MGKAGRRIASRPSRPSCHTGTSVDNAHRRGLPARPTRQGQRGRQTCRGTDDEAAMRQHLSSKRATGTWTNWSTRWMWRHRADAHDREQDRLKREAQCEAIQEMASRHAELASCSLTRLSSGWKASTSLNRARVTSHRWLDTAVKVERIARGMPNQTVQHEGPNGGPVEIDISKRISEFHYDELARLQHELLFGNPNGRSMEGAVRRHLAM